MADESEQATDARRQRRHEQAAALPATFVDSYSTVWGTDSVRISFGEYLFGEWHYRVAVVMPMEDAERLGESLLDIAKRAKLERESGEK